MTKPNPQPTPEEARESLHGHAARKGSELHQKYGPRIGMSELAAILRDPAFTRYPVELAFTGEPLEPDEIAYPRPCGERPEDGFILCLHPLFEHRPDCVPLLALYQLVAVNYGDFASADDAEVFAASALGIDRESAYQALCDMADAVSLTDR